MNSPTPISPLLLRSIRTLPKVFWIIKALRESSMWENLETEIESFSKTLYDLTYKSNRHSQKTNKCKFINVFVLFLILYEQHESEHKSPWEFLFHHVIVFVLLFCSPFRLYFKRPRLDFNFENIFLGHINISFVLSAIFAQSNDFTVLHFVCFWLYARF